MHPTRSDEIDQFKRRINLTEYAAAQGYALDRKASSRNSAIMRSPDGDKVVIAVNGSNGHWIYFSVRDEADNGTIIDFTQKRLSLSLGDVRKELRPWIGESPHPPKRPPRDAYAERLEPSTRDLARVAAEYARMKPLDGRHAWLEGARGIPAAVLADLRFADRIRTDLHRNAVFPHYNAKGLCGYELKNAGFTGFAKGGEKGAWASVAGRSDTALVIAEAAIDALSYHAIRRPVQTRYISIGGAMNPEQPALIRAAISRLPAGGRVIIATDNDEGGDRLADQIMAIAEATERADMHVITDRPPTRGQDWNDVLRALAGRAGANKPAPEARPL